MQTTVILLCLLMIGAPPKNPPRGHGDAAPPKNPPTGAAKDDPFRGEPVFGSLKEMSANEKKEMRDRRFHLFRLHKAIKKSFSCARCGGTGTVLAIVGEGNKQRYDEAREVSAD
jgi:hypothetical protein